MIKETIERSKSRHLRCKIIAQREILCLFFHYTTLYTSNKRQLFYSSFQRHVFFIPRRPKSPIFIFHRNVTRMEHSTLYYLLLLSYAFVILFFSSESIWHAFHIIPFFNSKPPLI